jgi:aconitase B
MTFQEAINNIASSIKQEEDSLSELLKQEAAKIQKFIDEGASAEDLLKVNNSVTDTVQEIKKLEDVLKEKLTLIEPYINK